MSSALSSNSPKEVVKLVSSVLPLVSAFQFVDGLSEVAGGILRARGKQVCSWVTFAFHLDLQRLNSFWGLCSTLGWSVEIDSMQSTADDTSPKRILSHWSSLRLIFSLS